MQYLYLPLGAGSNSTPTILKVTGKPSHSLSVFPTTRWSLQSNFISYAFVDANSLLHNEITKAGSRLSLGGLIDTCRCLRLSRCLLTTENMDFLAPNSRPGPVSQKRFASTAHGELQQWQHHITQMFVTCKLQINLSVRVLTHICMCLMYGVHFDKWSRSIKMEASCSLNVSPQSVHHCETLFCMGEKQYAGSTFAIM